MLAHLKQELIHGALRLVFGKSFVDAMKNGRTTQRADDVLRRWVLRLLSLGTRTQIPTRHMLDTLGVQTTSDSNVPSGYRLGTF